VGRGERGGADDGCPWRIGAAAAMARGGSIRRSRRKEGKEEEGESKRAKDMFAGLNRRRRRRRRGRIRARHR
jgi:hypothetical protein